MTLYLIPNFNYYNRNIIKYDNIEDYTEKFGEIDVIPGINFIPNDGIRTTQIINYTGSTGISQAAANGEITPGYVLVVNEIDAIVSRWWVIDSQLVRNTQSRLSLLRDVIADYYDDILETPSFMRKGYISNIYDNAIFNNEDMTFNQIKTSEQYIKDASATGWYIGYITKTVGGETISIPLSDYALAGEYETLEEYPYSQYIDQPFKGDYVDVTYRMNYYNAGAQGWNDYGQPKVPIFNRESIYSERYGAILTTVQRGFVCYGNLANTYGYVSNTLSVYNSIDWRSGSYAITGCHTGSTLDEFIAQDGLYVRIAGVTYYVRISTNYVDEEVLISNDNAYARNFRTIAQGANDIGAEIDTTDPRGNFASIEYKAPVYTLILDAVSTNDVEYTIPVNRVHCQDAPYDLIAIPQGRFYVGDKTISVSKDLSKRVVEKLITTLGTKAYDWQFLPYCPLEDKYFQKDGNYGKLLTELLTAVDYTALGDNNIHTVILYPTTSNFTKRNTEIRISTYITPIDFKVQNECDFYRLCSPNYNGQFEFSANKNNGVQGWNIACSYKPFNPYIRVAPMFYRLYGSNFEDARGLVCGGDFSIAQTSDAWQQYQINNKNYQVMFDRQIENMEVNNSVQRKFEKWNVLTGTVQGVTSGAMAGGYMGGPWGAAAGAIIGGGTSLAGGLADIKLNEQLRAEAMDYAKDQFGYQLQNIKAMPLSLTRVGAATEDYKIWPVLEYYTCSDVEKQALRDKMTWNGMTIGRIGKIKEFLNTDAEKTFIQANPIQITGANMPSAVLDVIKAELQTGVYIVS